MSGYNMEYFISDFAKRTKENMDVINDLAESKSKEDDKGVFEVTQRINSLLGLVIFPNERFKKLRSGEIAMNGEMEGTAKKIQGLLNWCKNKQRYFNNYNDASNPGDTPNPEVTPNPKYIFDFCKHLRNSVAHRGIHVFPVEEGAKIKYVIFYDSDYYIKENKKKKKEVPLNNHEFCLKLTVEQVPVLAGYIADFYINIEKDDRNHDYKVWMDKIDKLLKRKLPEMGEPKKLEVTVAEQMEKFRQEQKKNKRNKRRNKRRQNDV